MFFRTRKEYRLSIDNPCEQNWNEMEPAEKGKFCLHCSKHVIDFTNLSEKEILTIFKQSSGNLCGRLTEAQINRPLIEEKSRFHFSIFSKIAASVLLLAVNSDGVSAQQKKTPTGVVSPVKSARKKLPVEPVQKVIRGCVLNAETRDSISGVTVSIRNATTNTCANKSYTNEYGDFEIEIPDSLLKQPIILSFQYDDFEVREFYISVKNLSLVQEFLLPQRLVISAKAITREIIMGGAVAMQIKKKKWWQFWKRSV